MLEVKTFITLVGKKQFNKNTNTMIQNCQSNRVNHAVDWIRYYIVNLAVNLGCYSNTPDGRRSSPFTIYSNHISFRCRSTSRGKGIG